MRKRILILGSIVGIVVLLSLVAIGTYAVFTDQVASDDQTFASGTVDIQVDSGFGWEEKTFTTTLSMENMEAGDCEGPQPIDIHNNGTLPVHYQTWIYPQGEIWNCDPNPACSMQVGYTGPTGGDPPVFKLEPSETETISLNACLPFCAGNTCQNKTGYFRMVIHAYQQSHTEEDGWACIKMEDKSEATGWMPDFTSPPHGNLCWRVVDADTGGCANDLELVVNAYGLSDGANFQLDITAGDTNNPHDPGCTAQDHALASMDTDPYVSGYWNWGNVYLDPGTNPANCQELNGGEGVYNWAGVYGGVLSADKDGDTYGEISYQGVVYNLPNGEYWLASHVKEIGGGLPGTSWTEVLAEMDYLHFTIACP